MACNIIFIYFLLMEQMSYKIAVTQIPETAHGGRSWGQQRWSCKPHVRFSLNLSLPHIFKVEMCQRWLIWPLPQIKTCSSVWANRDITWQTAQTTWGKKRCLASVIVFEQVFLCALSLSINKLFCFGSIVKSYKVHLFKSDNLNVKGKHILTSK